MKANRNNEHENIYRKGTVNLLFRGVNGTEADIPGLAR